jgi:hypothetical protein
MLPEDKIFDAMTQRDLARDCVLEVDNVLALWRAGRRSKK